MSEQITTETLTEEPTTTTPTTEPPAEQIEDEPAATEEVEAPEDEPATAEEAAPTGPLAPEVTATVTQGASGVWAVNIFTQHPDTLDVAVNGKAVWRGIP